MSTHCGKIMCYNYFRKHLTLLRKRMPFNYTEMLTIKECSVIMRVSERTIRMLVKQNAIGSTRAGSGSCGKLLIPRSALLRYIDTL